MADMDEKPPRSRVYGKIAVWQKNLSPEDLKEHQRQAAMTGNVLRGKRNALRKVISDLMNAPITQDIREYLIREKVDISLIDGTMKGALVVQCLLRAIKLGDTRALKTLAELGGEYTQKAEVAVTNYNVDLMSATDQELEDMSRIARCIQDRSKEVKGLPVYTKIEDISDE